MIQRAEFILLLSVLLSPAAPVAAGWGEGVAAFQAGDLARAAREFEAVVAERPDWPGGHLMLGRALLGLGRPEAALRHLARARDLDPADANAALALAHAQAGLERFEDAARTLEGLDATTLSPAQRSFLHRTRGLAYLRLGREGDALSELAQASRLDPGDGDLAYLYGSAALRAGEIGPALAALERASRLDPGDARRRRAWVQALLRAAYDETGEGKAQAYGRAADAAADLAAREPSYEHLLLLAEAQLGARRYSTALTTLEKTLAEDSSPWLPHAYLGQVLAALERYPEAEAAFRAALDRGPEPGEGRRLSAQLGLVHEKQGELEEAREAYRQAGDAAGLDRLRHNLRVALEEELAQVEGRLRALRARLTSQTTAQELDRLAPEIEALKARRDALKTELARL